MMLLFFKLKDVKFVRPTEQGWIIIDNTTPMRGGVHQSNSETTLKSWQEKYTKTLHDGVAQS